MLKAYLEWKMAFVNSLKDLLNNRTLDGTLVSNVTTLDTYDLGPLIQSVCPLRKLCDTFCARAGETTHFKRKKDQ